MRRDNKSMWIHHTYDHKHEQLCFLQTVDNWPRLNRPIGEGKQCARAKTHNKSSFLNNIKGSYIYIYIFINNKNSDLFW